MSQNRSFPRSTGALLLSLLLCFAITASCAEEGDYAELLQVFADFQEWKNPEAMNGFVDYGAKAVAGRSPTSWVITRTPRFWAMKRATASASVRSPATKAS